MKAQAQRMVGTMALALTAAAILAGGTQAARPDDRAGEIGVGGATPDAFERAVNARLVAVPDAFERAVNAKVAAMPDAFERAVNARLAPAGGTDVSAPSATDGFQWADAALGAAVTIGLLMLGAALLATIRRRTRVILP
jgi:hypothetical protein